MYSITTFNTLHGDYFLHNLQPTVSQNIYCLLLFYVMLTQSYTVMTVVPFITYMYIHV